MSNLMTVVSDRRAPIDQRVNSLRELMLSNRDRLARGISGLLTPERVIAVACNSIRKNPELLNCTPASLFAALQEAATYGWVVDGIMGQASLVPFRNRKKDCTEVTLIPGYKGLRDLVRRSGECDVTMESVHEGDAYEYLGRFQLPKHTYSNAPDRRFKPVTHAYVVGHFRDGGRAVCFSWTVGEILAHRDRFSQNWKKYPNEDNPWHEKNASFRVMCMKTVLLDAIHRGEFPMSVEAQTLASRATEDPVAMTEIASQLDEQVAAEALEHDERVIDAAPVAETQSDATVVAQEAVQPENPDAEPPEDDRDFVLSEAIEAMGAAEQVKDVEALSVRALGLREWTGHQAEQIKLAAKEATQKIRASRKKKDLLPE